MRINFPKRFPNYRTIFFSSRTTVDRHAVKTLRSSNRVIISSRTNLGYWPINVTMTAMWVYYSYIYAKSSLTFLTILKNICFLILYHRYPFLSSKIFDQDSERDSEQHVIWSEKVRKLSLDQSRISHFRSHDTKYKTNQLYRD